MSLAPTSAADDKACRSDAWFVGFTKPRQETRALENLQRQGFECRLPVIRTQRRVRRELVWRQEAMFPRYLFLRPAAGGAPLERVRSTYGMSGLVRFAGLPATLPEGLLAELLAYGEERTQALFAPGAAVRFLEGPLVGLEGVFECADGEERAVVLLEFLQRVQRVMVPTWLLASAD